MANDYDYDYKRGRYGREHYDEPYYRGYDEPYNRGYGRHYNEPPYRGYGASGSYDEPYGSYDYGRYEYGDRSREPFWRGDEGRYREPYSRGPYSRGAGGRGFFERAGDEIRSWFGDEDAERRRHIDEMRRGTYAGRGPRGYRRSDERIREDVNDRLTDDWYIDASDVEVSVNNCMVMLSGRVNSRAEKRRAEDLAGAVLGVTDVANQLRVGSGVPITTETTETLRARTTTT